jgi:AraC-like DNA-binding protein
MLPNTISKGHGSPRVPKSKKSDDMSNILDIATRIFDQYMEKWSLVEVSQQVNKTSRQTSFWLADDNRQNERCA